MESFRGELLWRDYAQNIIHQFPDYPEVSYRKEFEQLPWRDPSQDETVADELDADERVLVQQHEAGIGIARGFEPDETDDEERGDGASNEQVKAFGD